MPDGSKILNGYLTESWHPGKPSTNAYISGGCRVSGFGYASMSLTTTFGNTASSSNRIGRWWVMLRQPFSRSASNQDYGLSVMDFFPAYDIKTNPDGTKQLTGKINTGTFNWWGNTSITLTGVVWHGGAWGPGTPVSLSDSASGSWTVNRNLTYVIANQSGSNSGSGSGSGGAN